MADLVYKQLPDRQQVDSNIRGELSESDTIRLPAQQAYMTGLHLNTPVFAYK
jgi:hypothetical protein